MDSSLYFPIFIFSFSGLAIIYGAQYLSSNSHNLQEEGNNSFVISFIICIILVLWLGNRPASRDFGDMASYAKIYTELNYTPLRINFSEEWAWDSIFIICHKFGFSTSTLFTVIEAGYILSALLALRILTPNNILLCLLFVLTSFSFFTFGVNGMRNGLAIHLLLLGFALFLKDFKILAIITFFFAYNIHHSVALPLISFLISCYFIKNIEFVIFAWLFSIVLSLVSGDVFSSIFANLGFDYRLNQYLAPGQNNSFDSTTNSFRWDFLLYSSMPVLMTWGVVVKYKTTDTWFNVLATTYCICNSFWILVIRASFSNRFAYLSWFLYPIIIAYPLIMLPIWEDQDNKTGMILYAYVILTLGICFATGMLRF